MRGLFPLANRKRMLSIFAMSVCFHLPSFGSCYPDFSTAFLFCYQNAITRCYQPPEMMMFYFYVSYKAFATFRKHKDNGEVETKTIIGTARIISDTLPKATYSAQRAMQCRCAALHLQKTSAPFDTVSSTNQTKN